MQINEFRKNNMPIYYLETNKFKTNLFGFSFIVPLSSKYLSEHTILAQLFTKYSSLFKTERELSLALNKLYDSQIFYNFEKKGKILQVTFYLHTIKDKYIKDKNILSDTFKLFFDVVFSKKIITNEILNKEINIYKESIDSKLSNPFYVASKTLIEVMFENELYLKNLDVSKSDVDKITIESMYKAYNELLSATKFGFIIGDVNLDVLDSLMAAINFYNKPMLDVVDMEDKSEDNIKFKEVPMNITQSTLAVGYRTNIRLNSKEYFAMCVLNKLLGGGYDSVLLREIREKYNLVYQINTEYDWYKGVLVVNAGVDHKDYQLVTNLIEKSIQNIKNNQIDDTLFNAIKEQLINEQLEADDNLLSLLEVINQKSIFNKNIISNDEKIKKIKSITKGEIVSACNTLKIDTIIIVGKEDNHDNKK